MSAPEFAVASTQDAPAWEVEAFWRESSGEDPRASFFAKEASDWLEAEGVRASVSDLYYLRGENLDETALERATRRLLSDPVVQTCAARSVVGATTPGLADGAHTATVRKKTGVMEPAEASLLRGLADLGIDDVEVRLAQRVRFHTSLDTAQKRIVAEKILSNPRSRTSSGTRTRSPRHSPPHRRTSSRSSRYTSRVSPTTSSSR